MSNPVTVVNLDVYKRGTFSHYFTVYDVDEAIVVLTSYTAILQIKDPTAADPDEVKHEASTDNGQISITAATGRVNVLIPGVDTEEWDFEEGEYDCFVVSPTGNPYPIARGKVRVYDSVTDPTP